jgi:hypothetical protein
MSDPAGRRISEQRTGIDQVMLMQQLIQEQGFGVVKKVAAGAGSWIPGSFD